MLEKKISRLDSKIDQMRKRIKGVEDYKIHDEVFDRITLLSLYELANKGVIDLLYGTIKTGKEANTFLGKRGDEDLAVKIHRVGNRDYSMMMAYIDGDHRLKAARLDIETWVPKVKPGGIIAFHDCHQAKPPPKIKSRVRQAVDEWLTDEVEEILWQERLRAFRTY